MKISYSTWAKGLRDVKAFEGLTFDSTGYLTLPMWFILLSTEQLQGVYETTGFQKNLLLQIGGLTYSAESKFCSERMENPKSQADKA